MNHGSMTVIHVHFAPADIDEVYFPQHEVLGDIRNSLVALKDALLDIPYEGNDYFKRIHKENQRPCFSGSGP